MPITARCCCFFGSSGSGRGFFAGPSNQNAGFGYIEGRDGGREYLDLDVECEVRDVVLCIRDGNNGVLEDVV